MKVKRAPIHIKLPEAFIEVLKAETEHTEVPVSRQVEKALYEYLLKKRLIKSEGRKARSGRAKAAAPDSDA